MKWYHYTGFEEFRQIVADGEVKSHYERLKDITPIERREDVVRAITSISEASENDEQSKIEFERDSNVLLTNRDVPLTEVKSDVAIGFELEGDVMGGKRLMLPRVSLEHMIDVSAIDRVYLGVRKVLRDSPYRETSVYKLD